MIKTSEEPAGGFEITIDQCQYGLTSVNDQGETLPARKAITFLTNCPAMLTTINRRCRGSTNV